MRLSALALSAAGCCTTLPSAISDMPESVSHVVITRDVQHRTDETGGRVIGACARMANGSRVVVVHLGEIADLHSVTPTDQWVSEVLDHELAHAKATCTDADH